MSGRRAALLLSAVSVALRVWLAWTAPVSVDLESYAIVAEARRAGLPLYESTHRFNYSPVWSWVVSGVDATARSTGLPAPGLLRLLLVGVDVASAALLFRLAGARGTVAPWTAASLLLANPIAIWVSAVQGQFDGIALFFLLAAIAVSARRVPAGAAVGAEEPRLAAAVFLALSMAVKQVTAFHPILWMRRRRDTLAMLGAYTVVALLFLPYAGQWRAIVRHVLLYRAVPRSYGLSELVLWDARWALPISLLALAAGAFTAWRLRFHETARASLVIFLVLLFFAPGMGAQYLVWPLTFGALFAGAGYFVFTAVGTLWILGSHFGVPGSGGYFGQLLWLSVGFWLLREARVMARSATLARPTIVSGGPAAAVPR